jgi:hypothetical protein
VRIFSREIGFCIGFQLTEASRAASRLRCHRNLFDNKRIHLCVMEFRLHSFTCSLRYFGFTNGVQTQEAFFSSRGTVYVARNGVQLAADPLRGFGLQKPHEVV